MNKLAPNYVCQKFVTRSEISNRVTRQSKQLHKPLYRTSKALSPFYIGLQLFGMILMIR